MEILDVFWNALVALAQKSGFCNITPQQGLMIAVSFLLMYLAIVRKFEPLQIGNRRVGKECRSRWSPYH